MKQANESPTLPRHPEPHETESLWGYILRVSQSNGFQTPWAVIKRAAMNQHEARGTSIDLSKLAAVTRKERARLQAIAYEGETERRSTMLLRHKVPRTALELELPRICPECVRALGFIEAHWDLAIMTACPVHLRGAVQNCAICGRKLRWFRPDLLHCQCGARIDTMRGTLISAEEGDLLEVIRAKVLGLLPLIEGASGMPLHDLWQLELRDLLRLVSVLENCRRKLMGSRANTGDRSTAVAAAVGYLRDWPVNFFGLLIDLRALHANQRNTIRELYSPLYSAFLRRRYKGRPDRYDFLRLPFLEFISNHVEGETADIRIMRSFGFNVERQFVTRAELSRRLGFDPRAVARSMPHEAVVRGQGKTCAAINLNQFEWKGTQPGRVLGLREAAKELGVPAQVLHALRKSGEFRADNLSAGRPGFHERDIEMFKARLLKCVSECNPDDGGRPEDAISLESVLADHGHSAEDKAALLKELLLGRVIGAVGWNHSLPTIWLRADALRRFWRLRLVTAHGNVLNGADAAKRIGCSYEVLKGLINAGVLSGRKSGSTWLIDTKQVEAFCTDFVSVSQLADLHSTSSRRIAELCSRRGIPLLDISLREGRAKLFSSSTNTKKIRVLLASKRPVKRVSENEVNSIADDVKQAHRKAG